MALKAGYVGVKRWIYEKLQATTKKNVQDIADIWSNNTAMGAKNILPIPFDYIKSINTSGSWEGTSYTRNGIVYTCTVVNGYVTKVTASETATADAALLLIKDNTNKYSGYILTGCPENGSTSTYYVGVEKTSSPYTGYGSDTGTGAIISSYASNEVMIFIRIKSGVVANDLEFDPMIRSASDSDPTYASFAMTNQQLTARTALSAETLTIASNENFELSGSVHSIRRSGNICEIYSQFKCLTSDAAWTTLASAPKPYKGESIIVDIYPNGGVDTPIGAMVSGTNGDFRLSGGKANKYYNVHLMYICEDAAGLSRSVLDTREASPEVIADDPEPVTKTTRKSTKKEDN